MSKHVFYNPVDCHDTLAINKVLDANDQPCKIGAIELLTYCDNMDRAYFASAQGLDPITILAKDPVVSTTYSISCSLKEGQYYDVFTDENGHHYTTITFNLSNIKEGNVNIWFANQNPDTDEARIGTCTIIQQPTVETIDVVVAKPMALFEYKKQQKELNVLIDRSSYLRYSYTMPDYNFAIRRSNSSTNFQASSVRFQVKIVNSNNGVYVDDRVSITIPNNCDDPLTTVFILAPKFDNFETKKNIYNNVELSYSASKLI